MCRSCVECSSGSTGQTPHRAFVEIIWFIWRFNQSCISHVLFSMHGSILHVSVLFICTFKWQSDAFLIRGEASQVENSMQITLIPPSLGLNQPKMALCDIFKLQRFSIWNCSVLTKSKLTSCLSCREGDGEARGRSPCLWLWMRAEARGSITHQNLLGEFKSFIFLFQGVDPAADSTLL